MIPELETNLNVVRKRARMIGFLERLGPWLAWAFILSALIVLVGRGFFGATSSTAAFIFGALPIVVAGAWWAASRSAPRSSDAVVWLDESCGGRGTLLVDYELGDERWTFSAKQALARMGVLPSATAKTLATQTFPALIFALACLWVPIPKAAVPASTAYFERVVDELREKLEVLEEEVELEDDTRAELEERLGELESELASDSPEAILESLDQLEARLEELALGTQTAVESALDELREAARSADFDENSAESDLKSALKQLEDAGLDQALLAELSDEFSKLMESSMLANAEAMDASELGALSSELTNLLEGKLLDLADAGLLDPSSLKQGKLAKLSDFKEHECDEDCEAGT